MHFDKEKDFFWNSLYSGQCIIHHWFNRLWICQLNINEKNCNFKGVLSSLNWSYLLTIRPVHHNTNPKSRWAEFNVRDSAAKECGQRRGHIRLWRKRVTPSFLKGARPQTRLFSLPTVLCVKVERKVFRGVGGGNRWEKCLKSLRLLRSGSVNTRSSQKRLGRGESAIPLGDTDAHETWSVRPGGDDGGGSAPGGRVRAEQLAGKVSWQRLSQHWLLPKN